MKLHESVGSTCGKGSRCKGDVHMHAGYVVIKATVTLYAGQATG
jgi:hypothetical protein